MMDSLFCCFTNEERYAPIIHPMKEKEEVSKRFGIFPGNSSQRIATVRSHSFDCPAGNNRRNSSRMLIPTGGTALQAVDREEALQKDMISGTNVLFCMSDVGYMTSLLLGTHSSLSYPHSHHFHYVQFQFRKMFNQVKRF